MGTPIDRTAKTALDSNLVNGVTSDAPKVKANNDVLYNYSDGLNSALDTHAAATTLPHADGSVTGPKIRDGAVTPAKIADLAVTRPKIAVGAVGSSQLDPTLLTNFGDIATQAEFDRRGVNVMKFGAVGDGVTNDTAAIQAAIDAVQDNGILLLPPAKTYKITSALNINKPLTIFAYGAIIDASGIPAGDKLINIYGTISSSIPISSNIAFGDAAITVSSTSSLTAGDVVFIQDDSLFNAFESYAKRGELQVVQSVNSATQITLENGTLDSYSTASTAILSKVNVVENVKIVGLKIIGGGATKGHQGIYAEYAKDLLIEDCTIIDSEVTGISITVSVGINIVKNRVKGSDSSATGYGVVISTGSRNYTVSNNIIDKCRHAFTTGGTAVVRFGNVFGNHAWNCLSAAFDTHADTEFITFDSNTVFMSGGGFSTRSRNTTIVNNLIVSNSSVANNIQCSEEGGVNFLVTGNTIYGGSKGVSLTSGKVTNAIIANNIIEKCIYGIYLESTLTNIESVKIHNNTIKSSGTNGIRVRALSNISVERNSVIDSSITAPNTVYGIYFETVGGVGGNNIRIIDNTVFDTGTPTTAVGIYVGTNYTNTIVDQNDVRNVTTKITIDATAVSVRKQRNRNEGSAVVNAGSTSVTIPHGLGKVPTKVLVSPYGIPESWSLAGFSATDFIVQLSGAAAVNRTFFWEASVEI